MRSWTTSIAQARFIKNPGYIPAVKIEAAYLLHFAQINLKTCESYPSERWREGVNSLRLALRSRARRGTKMQEGHGCRMLQDTEGLGGSGLPQSPFSATERLLSWPQTLCLLFSCFILYPCVCTHTHTDACIYFKELLSLCNSSPWPSVVFQMLFMTLAPHPTCSCIQLGFNYSLSCKSRLVFQR